MKALAPIPISAATRWRQFRSQILPGLVFFGIVGVIAMLWGKRAGQATLLGVGEGVRASVTAPQTVKIERWLVAPYALVTAGTPLVEVAPADARADFDHLRSMLEIEQMRSSPSLAEDNAMSFERVRVELLKTKAELAVARVKLEQAERDVARNAPLYREKLVSQDIYELALNTRDALKAEVDEKAKAIAQIEGRLNSLRPIGEPTSESSSWSAQLEQAQAAAGQHLGPQTLVAPISGMVSLPLRQAGEFVPAGEALMTVSATRSEYIIAYLRQPYRFDPQVGMAAQVTTRTQQRLTFASQIAQVGAQVEVMTNALAMLRPGLLVDAGLPVMLPVPPGVNIRPGEIVDIMITELPRETPNDLATSEPTKRL